MNEETNVTNDEVVSEENNVDYIEAIKKMKANTVSKDEYNKLKDENKKLVNSLINGDDTSYTESPSKESIQDLRKDLFDSIGNVSELDLFDKVLKLRTALIDAGEPDPCLPRGHEYTPVPADYVSVQNAAENLQRMVDNAHGNPKAFLGSMMTDVVDNMSVLKKVRR